MDISEPARSLSPTVHVAVLATLARTYQPISGRGLARLLDGKASQRGVSDALKYLVGHGLVLREDHPPAALFSLNRHHIAADAAESLGDLRTALSQRCASEIGSWAMQPAWVAFFGSFVRGEGDTSSDIDLAIVLVEGSDPDNEEWVSQIDRLSGRIRLWSGNGASIITFEMVEFSSSDEPLAREIAREGVTVWGHRPSRRSA